MSFLHKYFKKHSLVSPHLSSTVSTGSTYSQPSSQPSLHYYLAAASLALSAKVLYQPTSLKRVVELFYAFDKKRVPQLRMMSSLTVDRTLYYKEMIEEAEFKLLEAIEFDFECELPYKHIAEFC